MNIRYAHTTDVPPLTSDWVSIVSLFPRLMLLLAHLSYNLNLQSGKILHGCMY